MRDAKADARAAVELAEAARRLTRVVSCELDLERTDRNELMFDGADEREVHRVQARIRTLEQREAAAAAREMRLHERAVRALDDLESAELARLPIVLHPAGVSLRRSRPRAPSHRCAAMRASPDDGEDPPGEPDDDLRWS